MKCHVPVVRLLLIAVFFSTSALTQTKPEEPKNPAPLPAPPGTKMETVGQAVDPSKYVLGPEDVIGISTWREPDLTLMVAIRPDGKITLPLVKEVQAAGLTPQQLTADLTERIGKFVNNPDVTIIVQAVRSKKYYIDGGVNRSGMFPMVGPVSVFEALSSAGGFKEFANPKKIRILRGNKTFNFNWKEVSRGKRMEQNILLENGDHIIVPE